MGRISSMLTAICAATLLTATVAAAQGTLADRKTIVTFSGPVSLPGTTLPGGSYVFKLADSAADRHIVMVFDKDESKLITTLLAVPAQRIEAHGDPVVSFKETPSDRPPAVKYWYYAGEKDGNEFIYPRAQAMMIAKASGESVSAFDTDSTEMDAWKKGKVSSVSATTTEPQPASSTTTASTASTTTAEPAPVTTTAPTTTTTAPTPAPVPTPTTEPAATTAPVTPEPTTVPAPAPTPVITAPPVTAQPEPVGTSGRSELPRTASELPAVALIGLFALVGALGVRAARRSMA
jgi:hypothetical protein